MASEAANPNKAFKSVPKHIAIIMDGNNRWAKERRLPTLAGHKAGVDSVREAIRGCIETGVQSLTLFAFSSENWRRPEAEVRGLMELFKLALDREVKKLHKNNIRLRVIGDKTALSQDLQKRIEKSEALTDSCSGLNLNVAVNYGGKWDIAKAARSLAEQAIKGEIALDDISPDRLSQLVSLSDQAPPDLCIRTGGEQRVSNFLIWQFAYTEFYFTDHYWPDFGREQLLAAIKDYQTRERRFGRTSAQLEVDGRA